MPAWILPAATAALEAAGQIWGGSGQEAPAQGNLHLVNQGQQALWNQMARGAMQGQGDFGFGSNYKQGKSQVQDFMASRGVKLTPNSGTYAGAMGNMTGQALGADAQARNAYTMQLLGTPLQVAQTAGGNFLPGSPSRGMDPSRQLEQYGQRDRFAYGDVADPSWGGQNQMAANEAQAQRRRLMS